MKTFLGLLLLAALAMVAHGQNADCGGGFFSNGNGCCPIFLNGSPYYPGSDGCYPISTKLGVQYSDVFGCLPNINGTYEGTAACSNKCKVECFKTTQTASPSPAAPSPSASPAAPSASASPAAPSASASPAAPSASASPAAPSASASPAAPSASASPAAPSASPSAAPSTIVSTPQPSSAPAGCSLKVDQVARASQDGSWTTGDFKFQIYDLTFTNNGNQAVSGAAINVALNANQEIYQFWNIQRQSATSSAFNVPMSWGALQVGATLGAGYIVRSPVSAGSIAAPAVTITSTTCSGQTTAAPSPSASPAAPSASPAAPSPSANPTIVATPQPSSAPVGCSATVTIAARSAASGGVWQTGGATFQIFDISLKNNGQRPVNGGVLTFGLAEAGASIFQFWELNRQGSSNAFNVAFNYGALQAGANQGAGIVVRLAGLTAAALPTATLSSVACQ